MYKKITIVLCLLLLAFIPTTARAQFTPVDRMREINLDNGYYVDSWRLPDGGILYAWTDMDYNNLHLTMIDANDIPTDLNPALLQGIGQPQSIGVNACGRDIRLFVNWADGTMQLIHWRLFDQIEECRREKLYLMGVMK